MRAALVAAVLLLASPAHALLIVVEDLSRVAANTCVIGSEAGPPTFEDPIYLSPPNPGAGWRTSGGYCGAGYAAQYTIDPEAGSISAGTQATTTHYLTYTDLTSTIDFARHERRWLDRRIGNLDLPLERTDSQRCDDFGCPRGSALPHRGLRFVPRAPQCQIRRVPIPRRSPRAWHRDLACTRVGDDGREASPGSCNAVNLA